MAVLGSKTMAPSMDRCGVPSRTTTLGRVATPFRMARRPSVVIRAAAEPDAASDVVPSLSWTVLEDPVDRGASTAAVKNAMNFSGTALTVLGQAKPDVAAAKGHLLKAFNVLPPTTKKIVDSPEKNAVKKAKTLIGVGRSNLPGNVAAAKVYFQKAYGSL